MLSTEAFIDFLTLLVTLITFSPLSRIILCFGGSLYQKPEGRDFTSFLTSFSIIFITTLEIHIPSEFLLLDNILLSYLFHLGFLMCNSPVYLQLQRILISKIHPSLLFQLSLSYCYLQIYMILYMDQAATLIIPLQDQFYQTPFLLTSHYLQKIRISHPWFSNNTWNSTHNCITDKNLRFL